MNPAEQKASRERELFNSFCSSAGLIVDADSVRSNPPPFPDIEFRISGKRSFAELVEITDPAVAQMLDRTKKTQASQATGFCSRTSLLQAFEQKSNKTYQTENDPLILLAYYEKQYPYTPYGPDLIPNTIGAIAQKMIQSGVWQAIWVYDHWYKKILWNLGANAA